MEKPPSGLGGTFWFRSAANAVAIVASILLAFAIDARSSRSFMA
ncbi:MAG: hypothetical protein ACYTEP_12345 [Planctomycetota bacterium]